MNDCVPAIRYLALAFALSGGPALADTRTGADITLTGGYGSNPYLVGDGGGGNSTATGTVSFTPTITIASARSQASIYGNIRYTGYSSRYQSQTDYSAGALYSQRLSAASSVRLSGAYALTTPTALSDLSSVSPTDPAVPPDPTQFENIGRKRRSSNESAGFSTTLSQRLSLDITGTAVQTRESGTALGGGGVSADLNSYNGSVAVTGQLSSRVRLGGSATISKNAYQSNLFGDSLLVTPSLVASVRLAAGLNLSANAGLSFVQLDNAGGIGGSTNQTSFSGSFSLCRARTRGSLCLAASHSATPTTFSGLSTSTSASASYSYRTSARGSVAVNVNYSRTGQITSGLSNRYGYLAASTDYRHQVGRRLSAVARVQVVEPIESSVSRKTSFYGSIGISYRLGRAQ